MDFTFKNGEYHKKAMELSSRKLKGQKATGPVVVIIPARFGSKRFPGKPLIPLAGKPLIIHVWERARKISGVHRVIVATDEERIFRVVQDAGGEVEMTPVDLPSGSDRVGYVAKKVPAEIIVNLQGDEPLIDTQAIEKAVAVISSNPRLNVATLCYPLKKEEIWKDPNVVKVITDENNDALYFSRHPIPYFRDTSFTPLSCLFQHLGVYIYRKKFLLEFLRWNPSPLENTEKLEQLRILSKGHKIRVIPANFPSPGVDTPQDVMQVEEMLKNRG